MAMQGQRQGGGVVLAVITVLIILALIGGYVPVILALDPYVKSAKRLDELIQTHLYDPLVKKGVKLKKSAVTRDQPSGFEVEMMSQVEELALKGVEYENLTAIVGWKEGNPAEDIDKTLKAARGGPKGVGRTPTSLKDYVSLLREDLGKARTQVSSMSEDRQKAIKEAQTLRNQLFALQKKVETIQSKAERDIISLRKKLEMENVRLTGTNKKLSASLDKSAQQLDRLTDTLKRDREAAEKKLLELANQVSSLQSQLKEKVVKRQKKIEGEVKSCDMIREYAIVSLGKRQGMKLGDKVRIYRMGKGGIRVLKSKGTLVDVQEFISRVDLKDPDRSYPVIVGDIVVPDKKRRRR